MFTVVDFPVLPYCNYFQYLLGRVRSLVLDRCSEHYLEQQRQHFVDLGRRKSSVEVVECLCGFFLGLDHALLDEVVAEVDESKLLGHFGSEQVSSPQVNYVVSDGVPVRVDAAGRPSR